MGKEDTGLIVIDCAFTLPFTVWIMKAYFESRPERPAAWAAAGAVAGPLRCDRLQQDLGQELRGQLDSGIAEHIE
jgi:hypothetical protein